jgi:hypothetical protein
MDTTKSMSIWEKGHVVIIPHIKFNRLYTYVEIWSMVLLMKEVLLDKIDISIFEKNSYCSEVNGSWNVVFSVVLDNTNYTYMIRRDNQLKKTYGCPFYNSQYGYDGYQSIDDSKCSVGFKYIEDYLVENYDGKFIKYFPKTLDGIDGEFVK